MTGSVPAQAGPGPDDPGRWEVFRDVAVFQLKLLLDGARDVLLSPISLLAAFIGILTDTERPGRHFYELLRFGRQTDRWIDLFGAADGRVEPGRGALPPSGVDGLVARIEQTLVREVERGGMTASAKESVDRLLDRVQGRPTDRSTRPDSGS